MPHTVLVVDDDPGIRDAVDRALRLAGYSVASVPDGFDALSALEEEDRDLVVLDIGLPRLDGLSVCKRLRSVRPADSRSSSTPRAMWASWLASRSAFP